MFEFLSRSDSNRAQLALRKLMRHDIREWVLTGGFATEIHIKTRGGDSCLRPLTDIDFVTRSFENLPHSLRADYIFRHVHPSDPPGETILQAIDPVNALRIDVFRAYGSTAARAAPIQLENATVQLISLEDLLARSARLVMDLAQDVPVPSKYAVAGCSAT